LENPKDFWDWRKECFPQLDKKKATNQTLFFANKEKPLISKKHPFFEIEHGCFFDKSIA